MEGPVRYVKGFAEARSTGRYWILTLHPCGHHAKVRAEGENVFFPPFRVKCKKCGYKERAKK